MREMVTREDFVKVARDLLLTRQEWAALARVPTATVAQWLIRYPDTPEPIIPAPRVRSPLWWRPDIEAWMERHNLPGGITRPDVRAR